MSATLQERPSSKEHAEGLRQKKKKHVDVQGEHAVLHLTPRNSTVSAAGSPLHIATTTTTTAAAAAVADAAASLTPAGKIHGY
jgi:hypothetical protein